MMDGTPFASKPDPESTVPLTRGESQFLDPLIEDLHVTLIARNRYRG
jgi:hypothetical protein